jgi:hypothetical protein
MNKKLLSLFLAVSLLISNGSVFSYASGLTPAVAEFSSGFASVSAGGTFNSNLTVINIQDLHFNPEAQKNIFHTLARLEKTNPGFELYMEGALTESNFNWIYKALGSAKADIFIDTLFERDIISGGEYFAAKKGLTIHPLEDKTVYNSNIRRFTRAKNDAEIGENLKILGGEIAANINRGLNVRQKRVLNLQRRYSEGKISPQEYYVKLLKMSGGESSAYPNITKYLNYLAGVKKFNTDKLQTEITTALGKLKDILPYSEFKTLTDTISDGDNRAFFEYFLINAEKLGMRNAPLYNFAKLYMEGENINLAELLNEEDALITQALDRLSAGDPYVKNAGFVARFFEVYSKFLTLEVSAKEYEYVKQNLEKFKILVKNYSSINQNVFELFEYNAFRFNENNLLRNEIFIKNLNINPAAPPAVKAVIAGGFHTSGISGLLNASQISNITLTPKVYGNDKGYYKRYETELSRRAGIQSNAINALVMPDADINAVTNDISGCFGVLLSKGFSWGEIQNVFNAMLLERNARGTELKIENNTVTLYREGKIATSFNFSDGARIGESTAAPATLSHNLLTFAVRTIFTNSLFKDKYADILGVNVQNLTRSQLGKMFKSMPWRLSEFIADFFASNSIESKHPTFKNEIVAAVKKFHKGEVEIVISDALALVDSDDAYLLAAFEKSSTGVVFYVHRALMDALDDKPEKERRKLIEAFVAHEFYEHKTLTQPESDESFDFAKWCVENSKKVSQESYHGYLTDETGIKEFLVSKGLSLSFVDEQRKLLDFASKIMKERAFLTAPIESVYTKVDTDKWISERVLSTVPEALEQALIDKVISTVNKEDYKNYVIAVRKTSPTHVMETVAEKLAERMNVQILYIDQDNYFNIDNHDVRKFEIDETEGAGKEGLRGKNVILLEDTTTKKGIIGDMAKVIKKAAGGEIYPYVIYDLSALRDKFDIYEESYKYVIENPEKLAESITNTGGQISKYALKYMLRLLDNPSPEPFAAFQKELEKLEPNGRKNLLNAIISLSRHYDENSLDTARLITHLHARNIIEKDDTDNYDPAAEIKEFNTIETIYFQPPLTPRSETVRLEGKFKDNPHMIALWAALNGYTSVTIIADGDFDNAAQIMKAAKIFNISVTIHSENAGKTDIEIEDDALSFTSGNKKFDISEMVEESKNEFNSVPKNSPDEINAVAYMYSNRVKNIVQQVSDIAVNILKDSGITLESKDYDIVFASGLITPESEVRFGILCDDNDIKTVIEENLLPLTLKLLDKAGLNHYVLSVTDVSDTDLSGSAFDEGANFLDYKRIWSAQNNDRVAKLRENISVRDADYFQKLLIKLSARREKYTEILRSGSGMLSDEEYAILYKKPGTKFKDTHIALAALETALKEAAVREILKRKKSGALSNDVQSFILGIPDFNDVAAVVEYFKTNNLYGFDNLDVPASDGNRTDRQNLLAAWETLNRETVQKDGAWQTLSVKNSLKEAVEDFKTFIGDISLPVEPSAHSIVFAAGNFVSAHDSFKELKKVKKRFRYYSQTLKENKDKNDLSAELALLFADLGDNEIEKFFQNEKNNDNDNIDIENLQKQTFANVKIIRDVRAMPTARSVETGGRQLENYMKAVIVKAGNRQMIAAVLADALSNLLSSSDDIARYIELEETMISVFLPITQIINDPYMYEFIRNEIFITQHPDKWSTIVRDLNKDTSADSAILEQSLENLKNDITELLNKKIGQGSFKIETRVKTPYSIYEKLNGNRKAEAKDEKDKNKDKEEETIELADLMGIQIIIKDEDPFKEMEKKALAEKEVRKYMKHLHSSRSLYDFVRDEKTKKIVDKPVYEFDKGFTRKKMSFKFIPDGSGSNSAKFAGGELVIYTGRQHAVKFYGIAADNVPTAVLSDMVYKQGKSKNTNFDGITEIELSQVHLYKGRNYSDEQPKIDKAYAALEKQFAGSNVLYPTRSDLFKYLFSTFTRDEIPLSAIYGAIEQVAVENALAGEDGNILFSTKIKLKKENSYFTSYNLNLSGLVTGEERFNAIFNSIKKENYVFTAYKDNDYTHYGISALDKGAGALDLLSNIDSVKIDENKETPTQIEDISINGLINAADGFKNGAVYELNVTKKNQNDDKAKQGIADFAPFTLRGKLVQVLAILQADNIKDAFEKASWVDNTAEDEQYIKSFTPLTFRGKLVQVLAILQADNIKDAFEKASWVDNIGDDKRYQRYAIERGFANIKELALAAELGIVNKNLMEEFLTEKTKDIIYFETNYEISENKKLADFLKDKELELTDMYSEDGKPETQYVYKFVTDDAQFAQMKQTLHDKFAIEILNNGKEKKNQTEKEKEEEKEKQRRMQYNFYDTARIVGKTLLSTLLYKTNIFNWSSVPGRGYLFTSRNVGNLKQYRIPVETGSKLVEVVINVSSTGNNREVSIESSALDDDILFKAFTFVAQSPAARKVLGIEGNDVTVIVPDRVENKGDIRLLLEAAGLKVKIAASEEDVIVSENGAGTEDRIMGVAVSSAVALSGEGIAAPLYDINKVDSLIEHTDIINSMQYMLSAA